MQHFPSLLMITASIALISAILLVFLQKLFPMDFLASKSEARSNHQGQPRQIGGLVVVPLTVAAGLWAGAPPAVILAIILLWITGFIDDFRSINPFIRLFLHFAAATLAVQGADLHFPTFGIMPEWTERTLAVVFLVWTINMVNFMDGLDLMSVCGAGIPFILIGLALSNVASSHSVAALCIAAGSAMAGFAFHNKPPARIFLGDSGSLPLGFLCGYSLLHLSEISPVLALAPFSYYFIDSIWTVLQRLMEGKNILRSHSEHAYQRGFRAGLPVRVIVLWVAVTSIASGIFLLAGMNAAPSMRIPFAGIALMLGFTLVILLRKYASRQNDRPLD